MCLQELATIQTVRCAQLGQQPAAVDVWNAGGSLFLPAGEGAVGAVEVVLGTAGTSARQAQTGDTDYDMLPQTHGARF